MLPCGLQYQLQQVCALLALQACVDAEADMKHGAIAGTQTSSMSTLCLTHMMTAAG